MRTMILTLHNARESWTLSAGEGDKVVATCPGGTCVAQLLVFDDLAEALRFLRVRDAVARGQAFLWAHSSPDSDGWVTV